MTSIGSGFYSYVWVASGILTVAVPLVYRSLRVSDWRQLNMMYNWEEQWQQQQEQQQQQYNNYGNNYNNYNYYEQMRQTFDVNNCKWWQPNCFPYYINADGEPQVDAGWYPSWYSGWSQTEEQRQENMDAGITSGPLRFVYVWQILTFAVILAYGFVVLRQNRATTGLAIACGVFANMCFLAMWWLADGSIVTDTDYVQQTGFYGQFSVLMFLTNAAYVLFGLVQCGLLLWWSESLKNQEDEHQHHHEKEAHTKNASSFEHVLPPPSSTNNYRSPVVKITSPEKEPPVEPSWTVVN